MHGATIKSMKMNSKTNSTAGYDFKILKKIKGLYVLFSQPITFLITGYRGID